MTSSKLFLDLSPRLICIHTQERFNAASNELDAADRPLIDALLPNYGLALQFASP